MTLVKNRKREKLARLSVRAMIYKGDDIFETKMKIYGNIKERRLPVIQLLELRNIYRI